MKSCHHGWQKLRIKDWTTRHSKTPKTAVFKYKTGKTQTKIGQICKTEDPNVPLVSITQDHVWPRNFANRKKTCGRVFLMNFVVLGNMVKHCWVLTVSSQSKLKLFELRKKLHDLFTVNRIIQQVYRVINSMIKSLCTPFLYDGNM